MPSQRIEMFPLFRSTDLTRAVVELYLGESELSISELARRIGSTREALSKATPELKRAGVIRTRPMGRSLLLSADTDSPFYWPLRQLLEITQGPPKVLEAEFAGIPGISEIFIYGSWAERATGEAGVMPKDVDVVVVGEPDAGEVYAACERASSVVKREVNPLICPSSAWGSASDAFIALIKTKPLVPVSHERTVKTHDAVEEPRGRSAAPGGWAQALQPE